ncbi:hypothetical protein KKH36_01260 [Patescibacteria group bacterium]|nr:hypothetical protein [Patescibacteria group bacterium]
MSRDRKKSHKTRGEKGREYKSRVSSWSFQKIKSWFKRAIQNPFYPPPHPVVQKWERRVGK